MKFQGLILSLTSLLVLSGCQEDLASNRDQNAIKQPVVTEPVNVMSGIHRERGAEPISYKTEITANSTNSHVRAIPDMHFDDEGGDEKNVTTVTFRTRPTKLCGQILKATLKEKIADCLAQNTSHSLWNGTIDAGSAESTWNLVTLSEKDGGSEKFEIWMDQRTGMLWSDMIAIEGNWCESSGSQTPTDVNDPNIGENCQVTGKGRSLCTNHSPVELPKVTWRLPTRHDYLQADLDGIRFVLPIGTNNFWTATVSSDVTARNKAWTYNMKWGTLVAEPMTELRHVRCIGTPNF